MGFALYIHWPYCARICPYCDFNVYKRKDDAALLPAIIADMAYWRAVTGARTLSSIHFGGGTPSLLTGDQIFETIEAARRQWDFTDDIEIAIEGNPADANADRWRAYYGAGVNRMSLGVQSFDDAVLSKLGRDHDGAQAEVATRLAIDIFPSVSLDLIFGHAGQSAQDWNQDLDRALTLAPQHISAYQLTIEPGTAFAKAVARGQDRAVDDDASYDLYTLTQARLTTAGYDHYEVSNYAKPGHRSAHNLSYWRGDDYVGIGPGAHGRVSIDGVRHATVAALRPSDYVQAVGQRGTGATQNEPLSPGDHGAEYVMMGLRITEGISEARFAEITGEALPEDTLTSLIDMGLLARKGERIVATTTGRSVLNTVSAKLLGA